MLDELARLRNLRLLRSFQNNGARARHVISRTMDTVRPAMSDLLGPLSTAAMCWSIEADPDSLETAGSAADSLFIGLCRVDALGRILRISEAAPVECAASVLSSTSDIVSPSALRPRLFPAEGTSATEAAVAIVLLDHVGAELVVLEDAVVETFACDVVVEDNLDVDEVLLMSSAASVCVE